MPRVRSQLAIQASPELLERLRAAAAAQRRTVTSLAVEWLEAGLSGALVAPTTTGAEAALQARVEALEKAVAELQAPRPTTASRTPKPRPAAAPPEPAADPLMGPEQTPRMGDAPASGITTAELAERTGTNRAAWNNWARDKKPGAVRKMPAEVGQWRLAGKGPAPGGGPERWLWEPA